VKQTKESQMRANEPFASRYLEVEVRTANPLQLVVVLYDSAVKYLQEARGHLRRGDIEGRTQAINRTLAILSELQATLNFEEGGQIAHLLESLYAYMKGRLISANISREDASLAEVVSLLSTLKSAWQELAASGLKPPRAATLPEQDGSGILRNGAPGSFEPGTVNLSC
jgi:flagellar secretion chaperone FliS